jgi:glucose-1-phosphate thymidylyltransferase
MERGMRGIVLCGGLGTRLLPLTRQVNKHLLGVYNQPLCFYPLQLMAEAGIQDVMMVVGGQSTEELLKLCKDGREFGFRRLYYVYQEGEGGIAAALALTEEFVGRNDCCVVLGDNILLGQPLKDMRYSFEMRNRDEVGAQVQLMHVEKEKLKDYGVAEFNPYFGGGSLEVNAYTSGRPQLRRIYEKPENPRSQFAVIGVYFYDSTVFNRIRTCKPSGRGELEITDVNNSYGDDGKLEWAEVKGLWLDPGSSIAAWVKAGQQVEQYQKSMVVEEPYPELLEKQ